MKILCGMGKETHNEFGTRAWLAFGGLIDAFGPENVGLCVEGEGPSMDMWDAALIFDHKGDRELMASLRHRNIPIVYSPSVGTVKDDKQEDENSWKPEYWDDRKMKALMAKRLHFDTHEQAGAFFNICATTTGVFVPPAPSTVPWVQRPLGTIPTKLFWIGDPGGFDVNAWAKAKGISVWECKSDSGGFRDRFRDEYLVLSEALACPSPVVLWAQRSKYGERLLTLVAHHIPVAAVRCGTLPDTEGVNWYDGDSGPGLALEAAMQGVKEEAELSPGSWMEWAKKVMGGLVLL
jgi:hypothetical protein